MDMCTCTAFRVTLRALQGATLRLPGKNAADGGMNMGELSLLPALPTAFTEVDAIVLIV